MRTLLLAGDVMLGRGIDQILPHPLGVEIYEPLCRSALDYVELAERRNGPIPRGVDFGYVWGDGLAEFRNSDLRIVNLETAITCCAVPAPKGINYRCHPANLGCLTAAGIDCCVLANNHVLDWGEQGLIETLDSLEAAGLAVCGAGRDAAEAEAPAILTAPSRGRVLVYALGSPTSGIPRSWAAAPDQPGVAWLGDHHALLTRLSAQIGRDRQAGDIVVVSIHWGPNWGYDVAQEDRQFARRLVEIGADVVHGHSSHHPKAIELWNGRTILYGCGDFLDDYEGIGGHETYRPDLVLAYRLAVGADGRCKDIELLPFRIAKFRLNRATREEAQWLAATMDRECRRFGGRITLDGGMLRMSARAQVH